MFQDRDKRRRPRSGRLVPNLTQDSASNSSLTANKYGAEHVQTDSTKYGSRFGEKKTSDTMVGNQGLRKVENVNKVPTPSVRKVDNEPIKDILSNDSGRSSPKTRPVSSRLIGQAMKQEVEETDDLTGLSSSFSSKSASSHSNSSLSASSNKQRPNSAMTKVCIYDLKVLSCNMWWSSSPSPSSLHSHCRLQEITLCL